MTRRIIFVALLTAIFALTSTSVLAAGPKVKRDVNPSKAIGESTRALAFSFPWEPPRTTSANPPSRIPLGVVSYNSTTDSPGEVFGGSYYDYQQNGSMGRMIGTGPHSGETGPTTVHFSWMYLPDSTFTARTYAYNAYVSEVADYAGVALLHDPVHQYSGYVQIDVTPDDRALVGGHCDLMTGSQHYMGQIHIDQCPACKDFDTYVRVPDSMGEYEQEDDDEMMWPKFMLQFGTDSVLHILTRNWNDHGAYAYLRNIRPEGTASYWASMPYVFDSAYTTASYDIAGPRIGNRVAMAWLAPPPYDNPSCDTCSGYPLYEGMLIGQYDNDVYYQISENQGVNWAPRVNLTQLDWTQPNYKTYSDLTTLMDQSGYLHVVWGSTPFPADTCLAVDGSCMVGGIPYNEMDGIRLFHWSENVPYIRTIMDYTLPPSDSCGPPWFWSCSVDKYTISQCQDKLYVIWTQFHDLPNGIENDCAQWRYDQNIYYAAANGDIWMSVSNDDGLTWDAPRNLTNSYTPRCNPWGGTECENDYYASMSLFGRQTQPSENWSAATEIIPAGGAATDWFLDVQYVNDRDAGGAIWEDGQGSWTYNPLKWFRLACVDPVMNPSFTPEYWEIAQPAWDYPGIQKDTSLTIENIGNVDLSYSVQVVQDNGPLNWLTVSGFSGFIPSGLGNVETGTVHLNTSGVQATPNVLFGRLVFNGTDPDFPDTIEIEFIVADTVIFPQYDTVSTNCLTLACGINGSAGRQGWGGVNMDYQELDGEPVDCDTSYQASVYLYESSVMFAEGDGAEWSASLWSISWLQDNGLRPQGGQVVSRCCPGIGAQVFETGTFTNSDTSIAFEKVWVAPNDDCNFIIEYLKVWPLDKQTHTGLTIGQVDDWDLPSDDIPGVTERSNEGYPFNYGGMDPGNKLVWMQGYECYCDGDSIYPYNCAEGDPPVETMYDDERFAGNAFIESYLNGAILATTPYSAWVEENDTMWAIGVGFEEGLMYDYMTANNWWAIDSVEDLHTGMCFEPSMTLADGEYYEVVTVKATVHQGVLSDLQNAIVRANTWYGLKGGMTMFADINGDEAGQMDLCEMDCIVRGDIDGLGYTSSADVIYFVDWLWKGGDPPPRPDEVDVNQSCTNSSADLLYLVDYLWKGGPPPVPCE